MSEVRRSSRLKVKPPSKLVEESNSDAEQDAFNSDELDYKDSDDDHRPPKRRRISGTNTKSGTSPRKTGTRRVGKLAKLPDMPLDLLFEIFSHLDPVDLLHLARSTKALRGVLMSRSSTTIWKQSLSSWDLPTCPPDLNEPQYVRLAFDHHCHFCNAPSVQTVLWAVRARACKKCLNKHFTFTHNMGSVIDQGIRDAFTAAGYYSGSLVNEVRVRGERANDYWNPRFITAQFQTFCEELTPLINDQPKLVEFLKERREKVRKISQHASECERWYDTRRTDRRGELQVARTHRRDAIAEKLIAMGWGAELDHIKTFEPFVFKNHPLVKQPKELTDRIWGNIKPDLVKWLNLKKEERLERERMQRVVARVGILKELYHEFFAPRMREVIPNIADIFALPEFQQVINLGADADVSQETFKDAMATLPDFVEIWRKDNLQMLADMASPLIDVPMPRKGKGKKKERVNPLSVLNLAMCIFECETCSEAFHYQRLFHHRCFTSPFEQLGWENNKIDGNNIYFKLGQVPHHHIKPFKGCQPSTKYSKIVEILIRLNGLDPKTATKDEMDAIDARFACQPCNTAFGQRVMSWRAALYHVRVDHQEHTSRWTKLDPADEARAKKQEEDSKCTTDLSPIWKCTQCLGDPNVRFPRMYNKQEVIQHVKSTHSIEDVNEQHYFMNPDSPESPSITLKPQVQQDVPP